MHKNAFIQAFVVAGLIASAPFAQAAGNLVYCSEAVSYTHLTLPTIYSV